MRSRVRHDRRQSAYPSVVRTVVHFSPHPDDELIGAPATLMALRDSGWRVVNVACGLGRPAQHDRREAEIRDAATRTGFETRILRPPIPMSANDDATAARRRMLEAVERELNDLQPQIVVSPSPHDRHHAHELVGGAVRDTLAAGGGDSPRWWMWGIWGELPFPTVATAFDASRLEQILAALGAYRGELRRNDYRRLVRARAEMNASLGPELLFGFGSTAPSEVRFVELLTEAAWVDGSWLLGKARWLDLSAPLGAPSRTVVSAWLDMPTETSSFGAPGSQGREGKGPGELGSPLDEEERARLWDLTLHEDNVFNQRHALFLIAEAMLAVTYATALDAGENLVAGVIAAMGLLLTAAWLYVSARHGDKLQRVQKRAKATLPDYGDVAESTSSPTSRWLRIPSRAVTGAVIPLLVGILWVALLLARLLPP
jgi:LmbE family N-acetylglucosaminyl deacetylase